MDQGVAVLRKTIKLMNYIANNDKASGISELSKELDMPKATVQAAIGGLPMAMGLPCGKIVLTVAVLAIFITAPLGAFLIDATYQKLLEG